jgi:CubicO group peptidase (beta-lactamase class C family)
VGSLPATEPHILHSLSKSFTSTAIGFAVSEGLLTVEDPVLSFFPEDAPADPTPFLREYEGEASVDDGTGHTADFMDGVRTLEDGNWVRHFLANPPQQAPAPFSCTTIWPPTCAQPLSPG